MNGLRVYLLPRGIILNRARRFSSVSTERLEFDKFGIPTEVIQLKREETKFNLKSGEVLVRFLASPVNPADINTIQGTYPIKPTLPGVGGGEGVAEVLETKGSKLEPGDWVLPGLAMSGTWRTHGVYEEENLIKIRNDISVESAATLMINPATALRMLEDFISLRAGDWIVQNGANSAVGLAVIEIAKIKNLKTINVVRNRDNIDELKADLKSMGADEVLTEEEARRAWRELPRPRLALNCVGGASGTELCKALGEDGVHVTYGGMSLKPVIAATSHMIFKNLSLRGFWLSRWYKEQGMSKTRLEMISQLTDMIAAKDLSPPPLNPTTLNQFKPALETTLKGFKGAKFIFKM